MRLNRAILLLIIMIYATGCIKKPDATPNPWLVPFQERTTNAVSRSQMRAMNRLGNIYLEAGLEEEYESAMNTAMELYAGDLDVTFTRINMLIDRINRQRNEVLQWAGNLRRAGIDPSELSNESLPESEPERSEAVDYLEAVRELDERYRECSRIMAIACTAIPYNADLYYRTANLQYIRAREDGDRDKFRDAINYLRRAIATDSRHLESYHLIALSYEELGDNDRAVRFWRLLEVVYDIAPEIMGEEFLTEEREALHLTALVHLEELGAGAEE